MSLGEPLTPCRCSDPVAAARVLVIRPTLGSDKMAIGPDAGPTTVGGAVGGGLGALVGNEVGGRNGAIVGGALGGAAGAAVTTQDQHKRTYGYARPYGPVPPGHFCPPGQAKKGRCW